MKNPARVIFVLSFVTSVMLAPSLIQNWSGNYAKGFSNSGPTGENLVTLGILLSIMYVSFVLALTPRRGRR
jgi:ABC-type phosphate transport system permease subunit